MTHGFVLAMNRDACEYRDGEQKREETIQPIRRVVQRRKKGRREKTKLGQDGTRTERGADSTNEALEERIHEGGIEHAVLGDNP